MKKILLIAIAAFLFGSSFSSVSAAPTGCAAYGINTDRGVVYSYCSGGSGQHRSFGTFRKGIVYHIDYGPWMPAGARSYAYGPVGSVYVTGTYNTRN